jgi:vacuolar-type H+-ATPase subunit H
MNITDILKADQSARQQIKTANRIANQIESETPAKAKAITDGCFAKAREEIHAFEQEQTAMAQERIQQTQEKTQKHLEGLNQRYEQQGEHWLSHIVSRVTEL